MRIAVIGSKGLPSKGGTERVVEAIVSRLKDRHEITIYCDTRYTPKGTTVDGIRLIRIFSLKGKHTQATSLFFLSALHALFCNYDLIHVHGVESCFILPILRLKYKVVSTSHGTPGRLVRLKWSKFARFLIRWMEYPFVYLSNYPTSVSRLDADYLKSRFRRNVLYIPNGVDDSIKFDEQKATNLLRQMHFEPHHYLMFAAGRMDPTKGCHVLLEAIRGLPFQVKLLIVGDLNQVPAYTEHLREISDKNNTIFMPLITDRELLFGLVKLAQLFIFPSSYEGMSMMLLEAASLQAPIICSDIPENKIIMQDRVVYFRSEDSSDLAKQIEWALDHNNEMLSLGSQASSLVSQEFTWNKIVEQYEKLYLTCRHN